VLPTFVFQRRAPVHRALVGYKAAPTERGRWLRQEVLAEWLGWWLARHIDCLLAPDETALLVPVPSSVGVRPSWSGRHPLVSLCRRALEQPDGDLSSRIVVADCLLASTEPPGRLAARRGGLVVTGRSGDDRSVIVVDDILTSGARLLSAAAVLAAAGARVVSGVPIGRLVRPDFNAAAASYWAELGARPVLLETCGRCSRPPQALPHRRPAVTERVVA
jgi:predicted amidophosphoribosyltransferase